MKSDKMVTLVLSVTLDAGGEQYKPVRLEVGPGALRVAVEVPCKEVVSMPTKTKPAVLTPKGAALVGECLRAATLAASMERKQ